MITVHTRGIDEPRIDATAVDDPQVASELMSLVLDHSAALEDASAGEILQWAEEHLAALQNQLAEVRTDNPVSVHTSTSDQPPTLAVTMSMEDTVLAELASRYAPDADLVFIDTGFHFPETLEVARQVDERYSNRLVRITPALSTEEQDEQIKPNLFTSNPTRCCGIRKVAPLAELLAPYPAWVTGLKRVDAPTRRTTPVLQIDHAGRLKINPLVRWTHEDIENFIVDNDLIRHPLTLQGFPSIGCAPCTRRVAPGEDARAGRWSGKSKTECGIHL